MVERLDEMWGANRESVRRMLIGLTQDIDLAEDLLQETYLRARRTIEGYAGGDPGAWLGAIAKNLYFRYRKSGRVRFEFTPEPDWEAEMDPGLGSVSHLTLVELRRRIDSLEPPVRKALKMKYFGGFTYDEIARELHIPEGTVKWQIHTAIGQLRQVLMEPVQESCLMELMYLDASDDIAKKNTVQVRYSFSPDYFSPDTEESNLDRALRLLTGDYRQVLIMELDRQGAAVLYSTIRGTNLSQQITKNLEFECPSDTGFDSFMIAGEEVSYERTLTEEGWARYQVRLSKAIKPDRFVDLLAMSRASNLSVRVAEDRWRLQVSHQPGFKQESVYVQEVRVPEGARLADAEPVPDRVRGNTLSWRRLLMPGERFEYMVEYQL